MPWIQKGKTTTKSRSTVKNQEKFQRTLTRSLMSYKAPIKQRDSIYIFLSFYSYLLVFHIDKYCLQVSSMIQSLFLALQGIITNPLCQLFWFFLSLLFRWCRAHQVSWNCHNFYTLSYRQVFLLLFVTWTVWCLVALRLSQEDTLVHILEVFLSSLGDD